MCSRPLACRRQLWRRRILSTASRRRQNLILFRPRDKWVALKPAEGYILFRPRLLFMFHHRQQKQYQVVQVCGCKIIPDQLELCNLCVHPCPKRLASPVRLTCYSIFL